MNEMELLRELAQQTPLPAPAELDAARARLVAAIATDPATYATAVARVTAAQPGPSTGEPGRPAAASGSRVGTDRSQVHARGRRGTAAVYLIVALPFIGDIHRSGNCSGTTSPRPRLLSRWCIRFGLAVIALWLWMARATARARTGRA